MMRWIAVLLVLAASEGAAQRAWQKVPCPFDTAAALLPVECGRLKVPENPDDSARRSVELAFMVVRAPVRTNADYPVIFLNGGPGTISLIHVEKLVTLEAIRDVAVDRDWVFFDMRGTGRSKPSLYCPPRNTLVECRSIFLKDSVDLSQYNSIRIADDMEALRKALGARQWVVWGTSFGSRPAYTMARYYPASVRALVIDAPYLPEDQETVDDFRGADIVFNRILSKCAADSACAAKYPRLRDRFVTALRKLRQQPLSVDSARFDDTRVVFFLRNALYGGNVPGEEPRVQYDISYMDAVARSDAPLMLEIERKLAAETPPRPQFPVEGRGSMGMSLSVQCREEFAFESREEYARAALISDIVRAFMPDGQMDGNFQSCAQWPTGQADAIENTRVYYDGPQLVFTGELDATLSGITGFKIETLYANARHVLFRNAGHAQFYIRSFDYTPEESVYRRCALGLARQFLANPQQALDTRCAEARTLRLVP